MAKKSTIKTKQAQPDVSKVMSSVSSVVSFMKEQVNSDLLEAKNKGNIDVSTEELRKICFYIESSMTNSFVKASGQIEHTLK